MAQKPLSTSSERTLLIFDGDCAFCTLWIDRLTAWLPSFPESQPYQWVDLDALGLSQHDVENYAWFITPTHQYAGHLAFSALLRSQPRVGYRFIGHLLATPPFSWVAAAGYKFVATNRHRLPGGTPACAMRPAPSEPIKPPVSAAGTAAPAENS